MGSRSCIGRNLALVEVHKYIAQFFRHFDAEIVNKDHPWVTKSQVSSSKDLSCRLRVLVLTMIDLVVCNSEAILGSPQGTTTLKDPLRRDILRGNSTVCVIGTGLVSGLVEHPFSVTSCDRFFMCLPSYFTYISQRCTYLF
jgi:hypothetical protein